MPSSAAGGRGATKPAAANGKRVSVVAGGGARGAQLASVAEGSAGAGSGSGAGSALSLPLPSLKKVESTQDVLSISRASSGDQARLDNFRTALTRGLHRGYYRRSRSAVQPILRGGITFRATMLGVRQSSLFALVDMRCVCVFVSVCVCVSCEL